MLKRPQLGLPMKIVTTIMVNAASLEIEVHRHIVICKPGTSSTHSNARHVLRLIKIYPQKRSIFKIMPYNNTIPECDES